MTPRERESAASVGEWTPIKKNDKVERDGYRLFISNGNSDTEPDVVAEGIVNGERCVLGYKEFETVPICYKRQ